MGLSERAEKLQKEAGAALVFLPGSAKTMIRELLALVRDLALEVESNQAVKVTFKEVGDGNKTKG